MVATPTAPTPDDGAGAALARCVGDADRFLDATFTVEPHLHHGAAGADLLSLADVDAQLTGAGLRRPTVRLVRDGEPIDPASWTRRARTGGRWIDDLVDPPRLLAQFDAGATIVLQSLQRWWPPLTAFCRSLELVLGHPVQANAYLTPPGAAGLAPHHDTHDVFVLQQHGTKHWVVRQPLVEAPLSRHRSDHAAASAQPVLFETDLREGDCLYLPRGFIHSAAAQEGVSLHLTIGVLATTVHDVLRRVLDRAAEEPAFRRPLPPACATSADAMAQAVKGAVGDLVEWLARLDVDDVADGFVTQAARRRTPDSAGHLLSLAAAGSIDDSTRVAAPAGARFVVRAGHDRVRVLLADRTIDLPAALAGCVERLLDGGAHRVGELADALDEGSRVVLVRRLVREGLLRIADGG